MSAGLASLPSSSAFRLHRKLRPKPGAAASGNRFFAFDCPGSVGTSGGRRCSVAQQCTDCAVRLIDPIRGNHHLGVLHRVKMIEVATILVEAVYSRQRSCSSRPDGSCRTARLCTRGSSARWRARGGPAGMPNGLPGRYGGIRPVRIGSSPVMKFARPRCSSPGDIVREDHALCGRSGRGWGFCPTSCRDDRCSSCIQPMSSPMMTRILGFLAGFGERRSGRPRRSDKKN